MNLTFHLAFSCTCRVNVTGNIHKETINIKMTIKAGRYILRNYKADDAEELFRIFGDKQSTWWWGWSKPYKTLKCVKEHIKNHKSYSDYSFGVGGIDGEIIYTGRFINYELAITFQNKLIGVVGVTKSLWEKWAELSYIINKKWRSKGVVTTAVKSLCKDIFDDGDTQTIIISAMDINIASCRVAEKCGFRKTDKFNDRDCHSHPLRIFELTKQDYLLHLADKAV